MKDLRFYIDPHTEQPHIYGHNVDESEVQDVLSHPAEEAANRERSRVAIGRTRGGRILKVIYVPDEDGVGLFVITAYDVVGKPLKAFRHRMRRKR